MRILLLIYFIVYNFIGVFHSAHAVEIIDVKYVSYQPSLREFISGDFRKKPVNLTAKLFLPNGDGPYPVLFWVHGNGGQNINELSGWMNLLRKVAFDRGMAVYVIDSYTERGINGSQAESGAVTLNMAARLADTFTAASELVKDKRIDSKRIFIIGHSFGGLVSVASASTSVIKAVSSLNVEFAGHIPISPECLTRPSDLNYNNKPMHIIIGANDKRTPARHCVELVKVMEPNKNVKISVLDEWTHTLGVGSFRPRFLSWDGCGRWIFDEKGGYTIPDVGNFNNGDGISEFNRALNRCVKTTEVDEYSTEKIRSNILSLIETFLDQHVGGK
jgi:dienelactone hydrolase